MVPLGTKYFAEKAEQMNTQSITAFGIDLSSRYSKASEMAEMLSFACKIADAGLHPLIKEVHYDSKSMICSFTFLNDVAPYGEAEKRINEIASETIRQYEWFDIIHHGPGMEEWNL